MQPIVPLETLVTTAHPELQKLSQPVRSLFLSVLDRYVRAGTDGSVPIATSEDRRIVIELAGDLLYLAILPLDPRIWGFEFEPTDEEVSEAASLILHGLNVLIPKAGEGPPIEHWKGSLIPRLRDRDDPAFGRGKVVLEDNDDDAS